VLDEGRLTDGKGRHVNFKNTLILMTSNLPQGQLKSFFRPEFLNRLDEVLVFQPLGRAEQEKIAQLKLNALAGRLAGQGIAIEFKPDVAKAVVDGAWDPENGARPLQRYIQRHLEVMLSREIIAGNIKPESRIVVGVKDGEFRIAP
jgi:ATP-dependent Clp protease ATP-binding subunit ClpB